MGIQSSIASGAKQVKSTVVGAAKKVMDEPKNERIRDANMTRKGLEILTLFRAAKDEKQFLKASKAWESIRADLVSYEKDLQCSDAKELKQYQDIAKDCIEDIWESAALVMAVLGFLVSYLDGDGEEAIKELKEVAKEVAKEIGPEILKEMAEGVGKYVGGKGQKATKYVAKKLLKPETIKRGKLALKKLFAALIKKKKSQFVQIIDNMLGAIKGISSEVIVVGRIALTPAKIAPEMCGIVQDIREEQQKAFERIFGKTPLSMGQFSTLNMTRNPEMSRPR